MTVTVPGAQQVFSKGSAMPYPSEVPTALPSGLVLPPSLQQPTRRFFRLLQHDSFHRLRVPNCFLRGSPQEASDSPDSPADSPFKSALRVVLRWGAFPEVPAEGRTPRYRTPWRNSAPLSANTWDAGRMG